MIETARAAVDELVVVVYETPGYVPPAAVRAGWARALYPDATVLVLEDPVLEGDDETVAASYAAHLREHYDGPLTDVFSSEGYGPRFARYLGAAHVMVDRERRHVPISATQIRADPFRYRHFMSPLVYRSLVVKVCFMGAESTGKTTLAEACARRFGTVWMPEYGRELFELKHGRLAFEDLLEIAHEHLRRENALAAEASRFLFCDTNAIVTEFWSRFYFGRADAALVALAEQVEHDYAYVLCANDFPWVQDGWRETGGEEMWFEHQREIRADLERRGLDYVEAAGPVADRVATVASWLEQRFPAPAAVEAPVPRTL